MRPYWRKYLKSWDMKRFVRNDAKGKTRKRKLTELD